MLQYLRSTHKQTTITTEPDLKSGTWIRSDRPSEQEKTQLIELGIDQDILMDALDPHEVPRVETEEGWTYFITRLPDTDNEFNDFTTPILFAIGERYIVTVSRDSLGRL
jgi:magnesium transporter